MKRLSKNYMNKEPGKCLVCQADIPRASQVFDCEVDGVKGVAHSLCDSPYNKGKLAREQK